jgi:serine protease Do
MAMTSAGLRKLAGLGVGVLGVLALFVLTVRLFQPPAVSAQEVYDFTTQWAGGTTIGVDVRDADEADVKREKLQGSTGAVVQNVRAESAAAKAGMRAGDVIVSFDGERVRSARHFQRLVSETPAGRSVEVAVIRDGSRVNLKMTVDAVDSPFRFYGRLHQLEPRAWTMAEPKFEMSMPKFEMTMPNWQHYAYGSLRPWGLDSRVRLGVGVQDLTEQLGDYFGTSQGALVVAVDDGTPAKAAGLKAGDVITKVNGESVRNTNDLRSKLGSVKGETTITVMRDRKELTLKAKIED